VRHELKVWVKGFAAIVEGRKRHEIRKETDRTFREGDQLFLREWDTEKQEYTGRAMEVGVTYVTRGPDHEIPVGVVVMSLEILSELIEGSYPASQDDPGVTQDLLSLAEVVVPLEVIAAWSPEQRKLADDWASATCLAASDNEEVIVPEIPAHVVEFKKS